MSIPIAQTVQSVVSDPGCQDEGTTVDFESDSYVERGFRQGFVNEPKR